MGRGSNGTRTGTAASTASSRSTSSSVSKAIEKIDSKIKGEFSIKSVFGHQLTSGDKLGVRQFRAFLSESKDIWDINMTKLNQVLQERSKNATVELKDIYPIQSYLNKSRVAEYMNSTTKNLSDRKLDIIGYRLPNGKVILDDGHHRVAAAIINGDKSIKMQVVDVGQYLASKYFKSLAKKK